ncbi:MAG: cell division protein FtsA [Lentimonas sp.]|jgi:cell division protein FtsA
MISKNKGQIVACLDIGTTKLVCLIASINNKGITLLGYGYRESRGIVSSAISDMKLAQKAITNVICDAERMAGINIDELIIGLSGAETIAQQKVGKIKIAGDMVKSSDISNLAHQIRLAYIKANREIVHLMPLQYRIDDSSPVQNPRYMSGKFLSAKFNIVSGSLGTVKNIENCLKRCHLSVYNYICESYSSALCALSKNELSLGTVLIDIGGKDASFCVLMDGKLVYTGNFGAGGLHITKDIASILNINFDTAETIKNLNNSLIISRIQERENINLTSEDFDIFDSKRITKGMLRDIIKSRVEEILESVKKKLEKNGYGAAVISNVVLSGGSANIIGIDKLANKIFSKPVRIGYPAGINNIPEVFNDPSFCSAFGMLIFLKNVYSKDKVKNSFETKNGFFGKIIDKLMAI